MKPRIALVDDHTLLTEAIRSLLKDDFEVVATYGDSVAFLHDAPTLKPDVVIMDVSMPNLNGLDAAHELKRIVPNARVIFLTMNEDPDVAAEAFRGGASGYLLKRSANGELQLAIREVLNHRFYITPLITKNLVGSFVDDPSERKGIHQLTARQREVLQLLVDGRSMKEAAAVLNVSVRTIAFHKYRMMEQLRVTSTAALIQVAVRDRLIL